MAAVFNPLHWVRAFTDKRSDWPCQYRMIAIVLGTYANKDGRAWPGIRALAVQSGTRTPTVVKVIRLLEEGKWLTRDNTPGKLSQYKLYALVNQYPLLTGQLRDTGVQLRTTAGVQLRTTKLPSTTTQLTTKRAETVPAPPAKSKDKEAEPLHPQIQEVIAVLQGERGYPSPRMAAEYQDIRFMLKASHTATDIMACWRNLRAAPWWSGKEVFMATVRSQIGAWKSTRNGTGPPAAGGVAQVADMKPHPGRKVLS